MSFHVGQKVVCINDQCLRDFDKWYLPHGWIEEGETYVVSEVAEWEFTDIGKAESIFLVGKDRLWRSDMEFTPWASKRFRPLEELQQESKERYYAEHPIRA